MSKRQIDTAATVTWLKPVAFLSIVGLLDAAYLTYKHFSGEFVGCSMQSGCDEVLNGPFSTIGDIPLALIGVVYYATVFLSCLALSRFVTPARSLRLLTGIGFLASCSFLYLQLSVIKAICEYCMISFAASTLMFLIMMIGAGASPAAKSNLVVDRTKAKH
jgi:uncharacterized membrane protein